GYGSKGASLRVMLTFEDGARASYSATYESSGHEFFERGQEFYTRLVGERATLHVFQRWLVLCERGRWPRASSGVAEGKRPKSAFSCDNSHARLNPARRPTPGGATTCRRWP